MTAVYIVRCRFTEPAKEQAWNAWYSGPKIAQMLAKPYFRTCQRFRRAAGQGRDYLALWTLTSPEGLKTREYTDQWGFAEWQAYVTDWSRDLFDAGTQPESAFAVPPHGALQVVAFDGMSEDAARQRSGPTAGVAAMTWLPVIGLDRHTPLIGLAVLPEQERAKSPPGTEGTQAAIYHPIAEVAVRG